MPNKLKILRITHGYSQNAMAKKMSISYPQYRNIEKGKMRGSTDFWFTLQKNFNLSDKELLELMRDAHANKKSNSKD